MKTIVNLSLKRPTVTILTIVLVLVSGLFTYRTLPVELFPEIEFPLITITTFYPSANPEAVVKDATAPIENSIKGVDGLESIQSVSSENRSIVLANFKFGTDMSEAENNINSNINAIRFPVGVSTPIVGRIDPNSFPVLQFSVSGSEDMVYIQNILESRILPEISGIDGIFRVEVTGDVDTQVVITINYDEMTSRGISLFQVSQILKENNITFPAGSIIEDGQSLPIKTTHTYDSIDDLKELVIATPQNFGPTSSGISTNPITLDDISDIQIAPGTGTSISRTNGKSSIGVAIIKEPDSNTIDVTTKVTNALENIPGLPSDIEFVIVSNDGPEIQEQINTLEQEALIGLTLAVIVVFIFFITTKPSVLAGILTTLRPTVVIGLSIPLSILTGVLLMSWQGLGLNFMTLGGLAISVGRVVDDSIVVLENIYRNIQAGKERWRSALDATIEVGPAIIASTVTTIVVFVPLAFIKGLVGAFFFPFALTVSFALIASLVVSLTAIPVLSAYLIRPGDLPDGVDEENTNQIANTPIQRIYGPILKWTLGHKSITLLTSLIVTLGSLGLATEIPVNLFPSSDDRFLNIGMSLQPGTPPSKTLIEVQKVEDQLKGISENYVTTIGSPAASYGQGVPGGFHQSNTFVTLSENAPKGISKILRDNLGNKEGRTINIREIGAGPPQAGLDISIKGSNYEEISTVTIQLMEELKSIDGIENISSNVSEARDELIVEVNPTLASSIGLTTQQVAFQLNQFVVGQNITQLEVDGNPINVVLQGRPEDTNSIEKISTLSITGPFGKAKLGDIASMKIAKGPVTISRTDRIRSAGITGTITSDDTQATGILIQDKIDALTLPPGIEVSSGGVFSQITEGFQQIFVAMAVGIVLVYLVMVASLGSIRNPFVIVSSMPLAIIGTIVALMITERSLGLPAMMGLLLLIGIVVTNSIVLISFVEQLRQQGLNVYDALINGGLIRLRPILMTAITTSVALLPLAIFAGDDGGIIGAELATVVIGGLFSSTLLTLIIVPILYSIANQNLPNLIRRIRKYSLT